MTAEGQRGSGRVPTSWYKDPFGLHDARWFTDGRPTALVCDGSEVLRDRPPPEGEYCGKLEPYEASITPAVALPSDPERWIAENFPERVYRPFLPVKFLFGWLPDWFYPWRKADHTEAGVRQDGQRGEQ
jgi:hypothetical protein